MLQAWTAALMYRNVPSWLKFILEWEPWTPSCENRNSYCHLAFSVLLVSSYCPCTSW